MYTAIFIVQSENKQTFHAVASIRSDKPGADLGFYKGGCPIHLTGAPEVLRFPIVPENLHTLSNDPLFNPLIVHISAHVLI